MRRISVLIAAVLACAIISAMPAVAPPASPAAVAVSAVREQGVALAVEGAHQSWFADYNGCIWGIGLPAGVAWVFATTPSTWWALS